MTNIAMMAAKVAAKEGVAIVFKKAVATAAGAAVVRIGEKVVDKVIDKVSERGNSRGNHKKGKKRQ